MATVHSDPTRHLSKIILAYAETKDAGNASSTEIMTLGAVFNVDIDDNGHLV